MQLATDDGELAQRALQHLRLQVGTAGKDHTEAGGEKQQQRKEGYEPVIGDQGGQIAALIVQVFVDDGNDHPDGAIPSLQTVQPADHRRSLRLYGKRTPNLWDARVIPEFARFQPHWPTTRATMG